ncbi:MAG TPA: fumarylacetoacetate hydrolase family protein [Solirubrobacteraceae bacterium]|jgi:2-keto-4-pentenoate hydratase/2-oxohepta-3-ene-1,7-dioic acid hydratase in catechol pathway|nr:fumarylacetoacetate hydrolase family protein [Solirubrobacteraceae bacterium]
MRLATIRDTHGTARPVVLEGGQARAIAAESLLTAIQQEPDMTRWSVGDVLELDAPPAPLAPLRPGKIVAIGLNYHDHIRETGMSEPSTPLMFAKFPDCVIGPDDAIVLPRAAPDHVDWETELAVVVGRRMRNVTAERALDHVFGYTVANDVSARDLQMSDGQWVRAKSFDTFCPTGPTLVSAEELPDPQSLPITTVLDGVTVQDSNTREMIFSVAEILASCSACFPLNPGDMVLTGTPWGCGGFADPPSALRAGQLLESHIGGIGTLRNRVIDEP